MRTSLTGDVFLTLLAVPDTAEAPATIRVITQPLVPWLWIGGGIIGLGTLLSAFPGRRRDPLRPTSAPLDLDGPAAKGPIDLGQADSEDPGMPERTVKQRQPVAARFQANTPQTGET